MRMAAGGVVVRARRFQSSNAIWRALYSTSRPSNTAPPQPRPWRKQEPSERVVRQPQWVAEEAQSTRPKKRSWTHRLFALRDDSILEEQPAPEPQPTPSPPKQQPQQTSDTAARALEASRRYITEGFKDPRYRSAARRVTAIICALPLALYLSYELFQRRFMGKEQKIRPTKPSGEVKPAVEGAEATRDERIIGD
ncbi:hypothetical protein KC343_g5569 [Hortaea werneckii]|uniref:Uncharacterized protein n=1 Tax=Hortaea werneckii TaxID=91943 RepID=A0A3M7EEK0_HORWE|nr:hypothetical protein KC352_g12490 [Hortaea werneckii]KAI7569362.1 hypothetical protein KC317_g3408 [Hortaea werneckii]KAI7626167.1 hypothetical protein KC346_g1397 [Hortaea werneckii]KAI7628854.1 hypothetical protein KC343_g5569 [Hortaea werneckii]KAI7678891.1 hypothetical protein KC319_g3065 [Hortaea werneckii]